MNPVTAARSLECPQCLAPEGRACLLADADHLARYIAAWVAGLIPWRALESVVAELTVTARQAQLAEPDEGGRAAA